MFRPLIAATLSLALALPLTAAPAHAQLDGRDAAKILGGLTALYILKEALERRDAAPVHRRPSHAAPAPHAPDRRGPPRGAPTHRAPPHAAPGHRNPTFRAPAVTPRRHSEPRHAPAPRRSEVRRVPDACGRYLNTSEGRVLAYGARCMQNSVARPGALPPQCIRQVRTNRGTETVYGRGCLRREGWAMAAR